MQIAYENRKSNVLSPSQLPCLEKVPSINLTRGCLHGCVYCYARGYSTYPGEGKLAVYANTAEKLAEELPRKRKKPSHVYFSPSSDLFQPVKAVQDLAYACFSELLKNDVGIAFVTKGVIPDRHLALLVKKPHLVQTQIGLITCNDDLRKRLEPGAAPVEARLEQMKVLTAYGIGTRLRVAPIIPSLTDDDASLTALFRRGAEAGITQTAINTLHLRPAITASLQRHLDREELEALESRFSASSSLRTCKGHSRQTPLPLEARKKLFARVKSIAENHGIHAAICGCMNPDLSREQCALDGVWPESNNGSVQMPLFQEA